MPTRFSAIQLLIDLTSWRGTRAGLDNLIHILIVLTAWTITSDLIRPPMMKVKHNYSHLAPKHLPRLV